MTETKKLAHPTRKEWEAGYAMTDSEATELAEARRQLQYAEHCIRVARDRWLLLHGTQYAGVPAHAVAQSMKAAAHNLYMQRKYGRAAIRRYRAAAVPESLRLFRSVGVAETAVLKAAAKQTVAQLTQPSVVMVLPEPRSEQQNMLRQTICSTVADLVMDFLHYDRKEDEELPRGAIEDAVATGVVTRDEIVKWFREGLEGRGL